MNDVFSPAPPSPRLIANICRCSSPQEHASRAIQSAAESSRSSEARLKAETDAAIEAANRRAADAQARNVNVRDYLVSRVERVGKHLVVMVKYPSCRACEFEGLKTMVFLNTPESHALTWREIDPHFRPAPKTGFPSGAAPSPAARFPGNTDGWSDALAYARGKQ